jgi:hypothetical protein
MTDTLHLPATPGAPIACDMSTASDTSEQRMAEYGRLFERALLGRERRSGSVVFRFTPDARAEVDSLARREAACCPFLGSRVESTRQEVVWTITGEADRVLDEFHALAGQAGC